MKKVFIVIFALLILVSNVNAGFFSSFAASALANDISNNHRNSGNIQTLDRFAKVNTYLWNMHKKHKYNNDYEVYAKYLEKSNKLDHLDTVAYVYYDHNNTKKAIEIYEQRILPWLKFEKKKKIRNFEKNYKKFTNLKGKIDYSKFLIYVNPTKKSSNSKIKKQSNKNTYDFYKILSLVLIIILFISLLINLKLVSSKPKK